MAGCSLFVALDAAAEDHPDPVDAVGNVKRAPTVVEDPLVVQVSNLAGPLCTVRGGKKWTVYNLKQGVADATGIHMANQKILNGGEVLANFAVLGEVFAGDSADVMLVRIQDLFVRLTAPYGYSGEDISAESMTLQDAKDHCRTLDDCQGFWFRGGATEESECLVDVHFQKKLHDPSAQFLCNDRARTQTFICVDDDTCREKLVQYVTENRTAVYHLQQRELVELLVQQNFFAFTYLCPGFRDDPEIVQAAVMQAPQVLQYASEAQQNNRELVLKAVSRNGLALQFASSLCRADKDVVFAAIQENPDAFRCASAELQADRELALLLVARRGMALSHFEGGELASDHEVVLAAIRQNGKALKFATSELQQDEVLMAEARSQIQQSKFK